MPGLAFFDSAPSRCGGPCEVCELMKRDEQIAALLERIERLEHYRGQHDNEIMHLLRQPDDLASRIEELEELAETAANK